MDGLATSLQPSLSFYTFFDFSLNCWMAIWVGEDLETLRILNWVDRDILGHVMWCDFVDRWCPPPLQRWCYKSGLPKPARRLPPTTQLNPNHSSSTLPWPPFRIQLTLQVAFPKYTFYEWLWHCFHIQTCLSLNALTSPTLYHSWHMVLSPKLCLSWLIMLFVTHQHTLTNETPFTMLIFLQ